MIHSIKFKPYLLVLVMLLILMSCKNTNTGDSQDQATAQEASKKAPFDWRAANLYFLLTDRFNNGDTTNDVNYNRTNTAATLRGFEGGDLKGITQKIQEGYFTNLGVNAIWMSPIFEQIHGGTDESTGFTYGFHGYWTKDWTSLDANFGTNDDLKELIQVAHKKGIRILLDAVVNHTGPVTSNDTVWPENWVRTEPQCTYKDYQSAVSCTLVENLPDILTESSDAVELPPSLIEKWKAEGRYEQELQELDDFFEATNYPRAPRFYVMKWLADYISDFGFDGYRVDTVKHVEESVWQEFKTICDMNYKLFKDKNPNSFLEDEFYIVGELYGYGISSGKYYEFSDKKVNYFENAFTSMINFEFKWNAKQMDYESMFSKYNRDLQGPLKNYGVMNYITSHDDGQPFDLERNRTFESATKLMLTPGTAQIYYGDEIARPLKVDGAVGDANLRSVMDWNATERPEVKALLTHWQKLGKFRHNHLSVGAGKHKMISETPYVFSRTYNENSYEDAVVVGLELAKGLKSLDVSTIFKEGDVLRDAYSGLEVNIKDGKAIISSEYDIVLLEKIN